MSTSLSYRFSRAPASRSRASRLDEEIALRNWTQELNSSSSAISRMVNSRFSGFQLVLQLLSTNAIPGPAVFMDTSVPIGQGSQFIVYRQQMAWFEGTPDMYCTPVALKQPKFPIDPHKPPRMLDKAAQRHLEHLCLEVKALTMPRLRNHPNIVRLLAWGADTRHFAAPLSLVLELAESDLQHFLSKGYDQHSDSAPHLRYNICLDIADGLDAVHECGLVHGDLKPVNVLLFAEHGRMVAKLTDFGLSIEEDQEKIQLLGTPGWQAPEVANEVYLDSVGCQKADNYSFGLVAWSVMFRAGMTPPFDNRRNHVMEDINAARNHVVDQVLQPIEIALDHLLRESPEQRPAKVTPSLLPFSSQATTHLQGGQIETGSSSPKERGSGSDPVFEHPATPQYASTHLLEIPTLPSILIGHMSRSFNVSVAFAPRSVLYTSFLHTTTERLQSQATAHSQTLDPFEALLGATKAGSVTAAEVLNLALSHYKPDTGVYASSQLDIPDLLGAAVATGSRLAIESLRRINAAALADRLLEFRAWGGYSDYLTLLPMEDRHLLHSTATFGSADEMQRFHSPDSKLDLNQRINGPHGPTPLFLACARGEADVVLWLLEHGADPTITCLEFGISPLHWLFCFDDHDQERIASGLIEKGASIDCVAPFPTPFYFYPFTLPSGSPLHWAVVTASHNAVKVLINLGASVGIRDGSDPYVFDRRVRVLTKFGTMDNVSCSVPSSPTLGLSPLDYAAIEHDPFVFELLLSMGPDARQRADINATDEEGFSPLHRLSSNPIRTTGRGRSFSFYPFRGSIESLEQNLEKTVKAIKALGGDLDLFTTPSEGQHTEIGPGIAIDTRAAYTPLMLAALAGNKTLVRILLAEGADPKLANPYGTTALHCMPVWQQDATAAVEIVKQLIRAGAQLENRDCRGKTALAYAATMINLDAMAALLDAGADIDEESEWPETFPYQPLYAIGVTYDSKPFGGLDGTADAKLAAILQKHVIEQPDEEKRQRVLKYRSSRGETLLYTYAKYLMSQCVRVLLDSGQVRPNEICKLKRGPSITWQQTALDGVLETKSMVLQDMRHERRYSKPDFDTIMWKVDSIVEALESRGGLTMDGLIQSEFSSKGS